MVATLLDSFLDVVKVFPVLFILIVLADLVVYKSNQDKLPAKLTRYDVVGGGLLGIIPQCGISVAFAKLYGNGYITLGMLVAVFLSTSDEALIIIGAHPEKFSIFLLVIFIKLLIAISVGSLVNAVIKEKRNRIRGCGVDCNCPRCRKDGNLLLGALGNAVKITLFLFLTVFFINLGLEKFGEESFYQLLGKNNLLQPVFVALIGAIPSCFSSVFVAEAYIKGVIGFGSMMAGLCANTGYGVLVILKEVPFKKALKIILFMMAVSILVGEIIMALGG
ncbi:MAG: putative manganese transporter [Syntrophomonadaceae bacterium]|nr:putative manganese transporter [Syntrophomonadaceae bacterium]